MNTGMVGKYSRIVIFGLGLLFGQHGLFAAVDVQPLNVTRGSSSVAPGASLAVTWQIRNNGTTAAATSQSQVRITSSSSSWGNSGNNVGSAVATGTIAAGATINQNRTVTVPSLAPGTYYVWVIADNTSVLTQSNVNNDYAVSASFTITGGTVDVQPLNVTRSPSSVAPGDSLSVSWQIRNNGSASAATSQSQVRITSSSSSWGNSGNNVGSAVATGTIGAGATINQNRNVTVPSLAPGTYYVWVVADNTSVLSQSNTGNDYAVSSSFTVAAPTTVDVQPLNVTRSPSSVTPGDSLSVNWQIRNNGTASAATSQSQVRITSSSSSWGNSGNNVGSAVATGTIAAGATINQNRTVTVPSLAPGTYYVWVVADNTSVLSQSNTGNDYAVSSSFTVTAPMTVDVQPLNVTRGSSSVAPGASLSVSWQIRNNGSGSAATSQSQVRITTSNASNGYGNSSHNVGSPVATGTIAAGATINQNTTVTAPSTPGTYYVWVVADNTSVLSQSNTDNDFAVSSSFTVVAPTTVDVEPLSVTRSPASVAPGDSLTVSWQIRNNGSGSAATSQSQVRITTSNASNGYGNSDNNVGSAVATGTIGAGATINQNTTVTVPALSPGTYYVWVIADNTSVLSQSNTGNDFAVSSSFTVTSPVLPPVPQTPGTEGDVGHTIANLTPTFTWTGAAGATRYGLYISKEPYGSANIIYSPVNLTGTSHQIPSGYLLNGVKYRWNMTSFNSGGSESSVSPHLYFQTPASSTGPVVQTTTATQQGTTTARMNGTVNPNGLNTTWHFQYGTTTSFGQSTLAGAFGSGISTVQNVGYTIGGLAPNTLYYYRLVAQNSQGTSFGNNMTFQTLPLNQPDLIVENVTFSPSSVPAGNSFTVNFRIRNQGTANCVATLARLRLSLDMNLTLADPPLSPLDVSIPAIVAGNYYDFSGTITIPNTTPQGLYYVGIFADADNRAGQSDITNDGGVSAARVTVTGGGATLPVILAHPPNRNATQGDTVSFSVTVGGNGPFSYQWKREGRPIYGETSSQLVLRNVSTLQSGNYAVAVANAGGTVTSSSALLTVSPLTPLTTQPLPGQCTIYGTIDPSLPTVVITHGWQPLEWLSPALPEWVISMGQQISNRCVLAGLPANASGQRVNIIRYYWKEAFTPNLLSATTYTRNHGSALARQLKSPSILGTAYDKNIQFIGHSLGSVVNAYAVFDLRDWNVEQFTILDAPLAAPSIDPWLFHRYLPSDRVKWVDNYYGTSTAPPAAAGGVISASAPSGGLALNENHTGVHDFYHNTIANAGSSQGFFYSCLLPNFDSRPQPQWWTPPPAPLYQGMLGVFNDAPELIWYGLENVSGLVQTGLFWIGNQLQFAIVLSKPAGGSPLIAQAGGPTPADADGPEPADGDGIDETSVAIDLVIPPDAQFLSFKFLCTYAGPGDWLTAKFNDNLLLSFRADSFIGTNFQTATMSVSNYAGQAGQLVVKLNSGGTAASEFVVGDFSFLAGSAPVFSNPRVLNGAFQFDLRGLVGSNYVVQVSTNLVNWNSMNTSTIPTEGSITLTNLINGQPKQFYRAVTP